MYLLCTYILDSCIHGIEWNQVICWRFTLGQRTFAHRPSVDPTCWFNVGPTCWFYVRATRWFYVGPTLNQHSGPTEGRWANLRWLNEKRQRRPNVFSVVGPTLAQRSHAIWVASVYMLCQSDIWSGPLTLAFGNLRLIPLLSARSSRDIRVVMSAYNALKIWYRSIFAREKGLRKWSQQTKSQRLFRSTAWDL